jgi:ribosomal protein S20
VANIKSQKKRILTNEKARLRNNIVKSELKTATRKVKAAVEAQNKETAVEALRFVNRKLDKAVSKGVLHKKTAANKKSGLAALVNKAF